MLGPWGDHHQVIGLHLINFVIHHNSAMATHANHHMDMLMLFQRGISSHGAFKLAQMESGVVPGTYQSLAVGGAKGLGLAGVAGFIIHLGDPFPNIVVVFVKWHDKAPCFGICLENYSVFSVYHFPEMK